MLTPVIITNCEEQLTFDKYLLNGLFLLLFTSISKIITQSRPNPIPLALTDLNI